MPANIYRCTSLRFDEHCTLTPSMSNGTYRHSVSAVNLFLRYNWSIDSFEKLVEGFEKSNFWIIC